MNIYYTASLTGRDKYLSFYKKALSVIEKAGHRVLSKYVLDEDPKKLFEKDTKTSIEFYKKRFQLISKADLVVADLSHPSPRVGHEVTLALDKDKNVLGLYKSDNLPGVYLGINSSRFSLVKYSTEKDLEDVLQNEIEKIREAMDVRFNFFISPDIGNYLDYISRVKRIPRAVFLRSLVEREMQKDKEYNNNS